MIECCATVEFGDGKSIQGTPEEVLLEWGAWAYVIPPLEDMDEIKEELAHRAYVWCGAIVDPELPDVDFLRAIGDSGMVDVVFGQRRVRSRLLAERACRR
jgi:hypothetical protein